MKFPNELMREILKLKKEAFKKEKSCKSCGGDDLNACNFALCNVCMRFVCTEGYVVCSICLESVCFDCGYYYNEFIDKYVCVDCYTHLELKKRK